MAKPRVEDTAPHTQHTPPEKEGWPRLNKAEKANKNSLDLTFFMTTVRFQYLYNEKGRDAQPQPSQHPKSFLLPWHFHNTAHFLQECFNFYADCKLRVH
jgi:hypothetical protein